MIKYVQRNMNMKWFKSKPKSLCLSRGYCCPHDEDRIFYNPCKSSSWTRKIEKCCECGGMRLYITDNWLVPYHDEQVGPKPNTMELAAALL